LIIIIGVICDGEVIGVDLAQRVQHNQSEGSCCWNVIMAFGRWLWRVFCRVDRQLGPVCVSSVSLGRQLNYAARGLCMSDELLIHQIYSTRT
jgi:hypothetical protein